MSSSPRFVELPLHLLSMVLAQLDSMESLRSAIFSHSLFYGAFRDDTKHVVQCILRNQIPPDVMHYAAAAFETKLVDKDNSNQVVPILRSVFEGSNREPNGVPFQEWCLEWVFDHSAGGTGLMNAFGRRQVGQSRRPTDATAIANTFSKTHDAVEYFCRRFIHERLPLMHKLVGRRLTPQAGCPSQPELLRIRRALYRFQIYCNLMFRSDVDFHPGRRVRENRNFYLGHYFFNAISPWVDEQLCCIHDYLEDVLSRTFDDVAAHDVVWGALSVDWLAQGRRNEHKQAFVGAQTCHDQNLSGD